MDRYEEHCANLKEAVRGFVKEDVAQTYLSHYAQNGICIAFSGGVDSSLLLKLLCLAAEKTGKKVAAFTMVTKLHPSGDAKIAERVAGEAGAVHRVIHVDELSHAGIMDNPENRCYLCKRFCIQNC